MNPSVDFHVHLGESVGGPKSLGESIIQIMDHCGIDKSVVFPIDTADRHDTYEKPNDRVKEFVKQYPERIIGFCRVQPKTGQKAIDEMKRCFDLGFRGLKIHPHTENFFKEDCMDVLEQAEKHKWPVVIHTGHDPVRTPFYWEPVFQKFSSIPFLMGHAGKDLFEQAGEVARRTKNAYLDTSTISYNRTLVATTIAGIDKLLLASDYPYSHPEVEIKKIKLVTGDEETFQKVLRDNAARILNPA